MRLEKRDSLPLGLAHDGCALCLSFGVFLHFGSPQGEDHGGDLHTVRYDSLGLYAYTLFGLLLFNMAIHLIPHFAGAERE